MADVFECRIKKSDLIKLGPTALLATEMALNFWEQSQLRSYENWRKAEIRRYKQMYDESRPEFEKRGWIAMFNMFRVDYFEALELCETKLQMFDIYLEFQRLYMGLLLERTTIDA